MLSTCPTAVAMVGERSTPFAASLHGLPHQASCRACCAAISTNRAVIQRMASRHGRRKTDTRGKIQTNGATAVESVLLGLANSISRTFLESFTRTIITNSGAPIHGEHNVDTIM